MRAPRAAEFFAGIGLVRAGLETARIKVVWANDIEPSKRHLYATNFDARHFVLDDVRSVHGHSLPDVELATASFPCTDLSLAGNRAGLAGSESSMFWEFARVLIEMGDRRPPVVMLENVPSFATSRGGSDLRAALDALHALGYVTDLFVLDARHFVAQSRPRLFIVGARKPLPLADDWQSPLRPPWVERLSSAFPAGTMVAHRLPPLPDADHVLASAVERMPEGDPRWWEPERVARFLDSLSPLQAARLTYFRDGPDLRWATAYRRTRRRRAVWEIRPDEIAGCLRTARGGSSKQAVVETGRGELRVRWLTAREYARLQGAPDLSLGLATELQAIFGLGDAVCVPAVAWIARHYLRPLIAHNLGRRVAFHVETEVPALGAPAAV